MHQRQEGPPPAAIDQELTRRPLTDNGNGERLVAMFPDRIRYCVEMMKWLVWDGRRWAAHECGEASLLAIHMARELHAHALFMDESSEKARDLCEAMIEWARTSESQERIMAALKRAAPSQGFQFQQKSWISKLIF